MKALILAGGKGTRLRPLTYSLAKQLVPVGNKPVIEYGIESIVGVGIRDLGIIVSETRSEIEAVVGDGSRWGATITYIPQPEPLGLAHAVMTAEPYLGSSPFIMYLGDNLIKSDIHQFVAEFEQHRPAATILLTPVPNPSDFGVAEMEQDQVVRLEEKPKNPRSNLALVGVYLFSPVIHEVNRTLRPSARGEYEITDAIQGLIDRGLSVRSHVVTGWWKDTGTVEAILEANRLVLEDLVPGCEGEVDQASRIEGRVRIGPGTVVRESVIRGPAVIGSGCRIERAFVGPFTSIDDRCSVRNAELENAVVMADSTIHDSPTRIESSLLGRGAVVARADGMPRTLRLVMGDSSRVIFP